MGGAVGLEVPPKLLGCHPGLQTLRRHPVRSPGVDPHAVDDKLVEVPVAVADFIGVNSSKGLGGQEGRLLNGGGRIKQEESVKFYQGQWQKLIT